MPAYTTLPALMLRSATLALVVAAGFAAAPALAGEPAPAAAKGPAGAKSLETLLAAPALTAEQEKARYAAERRRVNAESELRQLQRKHFNTTNVAVRESGIAKLRDPKGTFVDSATWPALLAILKDDKPDVQRAVVNIFVDDAADHGDTALAWTAIYHRDAAMRDLAATELLKKVKTRGQGDARLGATEGVRSLVLMALRKHDAVTTQRAGQLSVLLNIYEVIPALIMGQVMQVQQPVSQAGPLGGGGISGGGAGGAGGIGSGSQFGADDGLSLGYIFVGQHLAYVARVNPVVGDGAVAFDPQLEVLTTGAVVRIIDAAVTIRYDADMHNALVDLGSAGAGSNMRALGYDQAKWMDWYENEFKPMMAKRDEAARAKAAGGAVLPVK